MRRMPPNEDEQPGDMASTNKARRRHTVTEQEDTYYNDEHPEVPKVRRASLPLSGAPNPLPLPEPTKRSRSEYLPDDEWEQTISPPKQTRRSRTERLPDDEWEQTISPPKQTRRSRTERLPDDEWEQTTRPARETKRSRAERLPDDEWEQATYSAEQTKRARTKRVREDDGYQESDEDQPMSSTSGKIVVTPRHHPIAYEPQPADYHKPLRRPLRRQRRSQQAVWANVSRNRVVLFAGSVLIALVIIVPLLAHFSQGSLATSIQTIGNMDQTSSMSSQHMPGIARNTDHPAPPVYATAAFLLDADTGAMLYANNASMHLPMMSTTKLMTGLLAAQHGNLDQRVTINDSIANDINNQLSADSSIMGAKKGETYALRELLYGLMLPSGNDAAIVIADTISGSVPKFVGLMNQRAQELGLHDTHYENPHGLIANGHYSSARDLALLGKVVMDVPVLQQITSTKEYHLAATRDHAEHFFTNGNQFMWWYPGVNGGKIGWDGGANFVQVVSVTRNKHHLIGVAMHTINWWTDMRDMMNWGFNNFTWLSPREINASGKLIPYAAAWNYFARDQRDFSIPISNQGRYYVFTGYSVTQPVVSFFDKNGGLAKIGFPIGQPQTSMLSLVTQRFEHGTVQCDLTSKQCKRV